MAQVGRPPTPIEQKRKLGNPGGRPMPDANKTIALRPADGVPPVPVTLEAPGRAFWPKVWEAAKWLSLDIDGPSVEEACRTIDEVQSMRARIAQEGLTYIRPITTPSGHQVGEEMVPNPLLKEMRSASKQMQSWLSDLGFTPTARARLGLAEVKTQSAFEELKQRRAGA